MNAQNRKLPDYSLSLHSPPITAAMVKSAGRTMYTEVVLGHPYSSKIDTANVIKVFFTSDGRLSKTEDYYYVEPEGEKEQRYHIKHYSPYDVYQRITFNYDGASNLLSEKEDMVYPQNSHVLIMAALAERDERTSSHIIATDEENLHFQDSLMRRGVPEEVVSEKQKTYRYNRDGNPVFFEDKAWGRKTRYTYMHFADGSVKVQRAITGQKDNEGYSVSECRFTYNAGGKLVSVSSYHNADSTKSLQEHDKFEERIYTYTTAGLNDTLKIIGGNRTLLRVKTYEDTLLTSLTVFNAPQGRLSFDSVTRQQFSYTKGLLTGYKHILYSANKIQSTICETYDYDEGGRLIETKLFDNCDMSKRPRQQHLYFYGTLTDEITARRKISFTKR